MGLYDKTYKSFAFGFETEKIKSIALPLLAFFIILVIIFLASTAIAPKPIEARLLDNPLNLQEKPYTLLEVKVTNVTESDASNVSVVVEAANKEAIFIGPGLKEKKSLAIIERGQYRKLHFLVSPKSGIEEGSYLIKIKVTMNNKLFEENIALVVKPH